ncbi:hypothetical protein [Enhygromyxa salina]|nr:hypothetical protein [Enhygromyxa salina]
MLDHPDDAVAMLGIRALDECCQCDTARTLHLLDRLAAGSAEHDFALLHAARWGDRTDTLLARLASLTMRGPVVEASLWLGHLAPLQTLRRCLQGRHDFARELAPYLGVLGDAQDATLISSRASEGLCAQEFEALGRIGLAGSVPLLLSALSETNDAELAVVIAAALEQTCGAGLREQISNSLDPEEPPEVIERVSIDPQRWAAWWRAHGSGFDPGRAYRRGRLAGPLALIEEILDPDLPSTWRRRALLDLRVRARWSLRLGTCWPIVEQLQVLHPAHAHAQSQVTA